MFLKEWWNNQRDKEILSEAGMAVAEKEKIETEDGKKPGISKTRNWWSRSLRMYTGKAGGRKGKTIREIQENIQGIERIQERSNEYSQKYQEDLEKVKKRIKKNNKLARETYQKNLRDYQAKLQKEKFWAEKIENSKRRLRGR